MEKLHISSIFPIFFTPSFFFLLLYQREENTFQQIFKYPSSKANTGNVYVPVPFSQITPPLLLPLNPKVCPVPLCLLCCRWRDTRMPCQSRLVVSDSLWPHGPYSPWSSPGQNTRVSSLSLLQGSSQPRDQTQVSHIAGRFFTSWATKEARICLWLTHTDVWPKPSQYCKVIIFHLK